MHLAGADLGVSVLFLWAETKVPKENSPVQPGEHYLLMCQHQGLNPRCNDERPDH